jgi:hypothetical protein
LQNWNSGIPEKREKTRKNPIPLSHNGALKTFFKAIFLHQPRCLRKKSNEPFLNSCMGNTLQRGTEED